MQKHPSSLFRISLLLIFFVEVMSFFGYLFPPFNPIALGILTVLTLILSIKNLEIGWLILVVELIIASKGHLFSIVFFDVPVSLRLTLFLSVLTAAIVHIVRSKSFGLKHTLLWRPFLAVLLILGMGVIVGMISGNDLRTLFLDANGYLFVGAALIVAQLPAHRDAIDRLLRVVCAALTASIVKTLILLFFFSHQIPFVLPYLYRWIRVTGVGEITAMSSGFYRIFFQSHLFEVFAFLILLTLLLCWDRKEKRSAARLGLWGGSIATTMIWLLSYSRSFWLGAAAGLVALGIGYWKLGRARWMGIARAGFSVMGILLASAALILGIVKFPYPRPSALVVSDLISERTEDLSSEAGSASRMALLAPLARQAMKNPITGMGFGTTVTYRTSDPRALQTNPSGNYSTYAFEWGYLGFIVKFGLIGTAALLWFYGSIGWQGIQLLRGQLTPKRRALVFGTLVSLFVLLVVHATTPYLDHPIGLGFALIAFTLFRGLDHPSSLTA